MQTFNTLKPYIRHVFDDCGGVTSDDYRTFERKYRNYLKKVCQANGWELVKFSPNHYEFSCFIKDLATNQFIYMSISDVRYWQGRWAKDILIRLADSETDYHGKGNNSIELENLERGISNLFAHKYVYASW